MPDAGTFAAVFSCSSVTCESTLYLADIKSWSRRSAEVRAYKILFRSILYDVACLVEREESKKYQDRLNERFLRSTQVFAGSGRVDYE